MKFFAMIIGLSMQSALGFSAADCSEQKISFAELSTLASQSVNMLDFLKKIPKDSMQNFTFVTNSKSLQKGRGEGSVSPLWPRVLRSTIDGRLTISFVCDPRNPSYGTVEILHIDENDSELRAAELNFQNGNKVEHNPASCVACHAASSLNGQSSLKFIWQPYFLWGNADRTKGIQLYGFDDDYMGEGSPRSVMHLDPTITDIAIEQAHKEEFADYQKFRSVQKDNPCFNSLPWQETNKKDFQYFPYDAGGVGDELRSDRPNERFTAAYARWLARRNFKLIKNGKLYDALKYHVLAEGGEDCQADQAAVRKILGAHFDFGSPPPRNKPLLKNMPGRILQALAVNSGLHAQDWTLDFRSSDMTYNTGEASIAKLVLGAIAKDIAAENPNIAAVSRSIVDPVFWRTGDWKAEHGQYGFAYSCLDTIVTPLEFTQSSSHVDACGVIKSEALAHQGTISLAPENSNKLTQKNASIQNGARLVEADSKGKCVQCHTPGMSGRNLFSMERLMFLAAKNASASERSLADRHIKSFARDELSKSLQNILLVSKAMPPFTNNLTDQERRDIAAYILSLFDER